MEKQQAKWAAMAPGERIRTLVEGTDPLKVAQDADKLGVPYFMQFIADPNIKYTLQLKKKIYYDPAKRLFFGYLEKYPAVCSQGTSQEEVQNNLKKYLEHYLSYVNPCK